MCGSDSVFQAIMEDLSGLRILSQDRFQPVHAKSAWATCQSHVELRIGPFRADGKFRKHKQENGFRQMGQPIELIATAAPVGGAAAETEWHIRAQRRGHLRQPLQVELQLPDLVQSQQSGRRIGSRLPCAGYWCWMVSCITRPLSSGAVVTSYTDSAACGTASEWDGTGRRGRRVG